MLVSAHPTTADSPAPPNPAPSPVRVGIVVFDGVTMLDASGPAEALHLAGRSGGSYAVDFLSPHGGTVATSSGMAIADTIPARAAGAVDTLVVAGAEHLAGPAVDPDLLTAVEALAGPARRVASVCTGAFVLAELGLLDGRRATTHWRHASALARRYPAIDVDPDVIQLRDGRFLTSAGITAGIDLSLAIIEDDLGAEAARGTARELVVFLQRPGGQSQFAAAPMPASPDPVLRPVIEAVRADPAGDHTAPALAARAAVSPRHLSRLFDREIGMPPTRWVESVRLEQAQRLLLEGASVTRAAQRSGFGSDETLRRVFARHLRTTPSEYRDRFRTTERDTTGHGGTTDRVDSTTAVAPGKK